MSQTPVTITGSGTYRVTMPAQATVGSKDYTFEKWENNSTLNPRDVVLGNINLFIKANYLEVISMVDKTFIGTVLKQEKAGETVTITLTKPDATVETFTALTDAAGNFTAIRTCTLAGLYSAKAKVPPDAIYEGAESLATTFTLALLPRTITLNTVA